MSLRTLLPSLPNLGFFRKPLLLILVPTLLCAAYWRFFYTPTYEAVVIVVPRSGERPAANDVAGAMLGSALRSKDIDSRMLEHYLQSSDMLARLDRDLDLRAHFSSSSINRFQRLAPDASSDAFLAHYRGHLRVIVDSSALLHIQIKAYDSAFALQLADLILQHAETFLNGVSVTLAKKQVEFIQGEVAKAENQLRVATQNLAKHQTRSGQLDPSRYSSVLMEVISKLEGELTRSQATLAGKLSFLSADAPQLTAERARIDAISREIAGLRDRLASSGGDAKSPGLASDILDFSNVLIETEFAAKTYSATLLALQAAHADAAYNVRTLIVLSRPATLENPAYPRNGYWALTALVLFALLFVLFKLVYDTIGAHVDR